MNEATHILEEAEKIFFRFGIKSVTMDDVARHLSISKKTLYKHVENKADLVKQVMSFHIDDDKGRICSIQDNTENAISELLKIGEHVTYKLSNLNPAVLYDLQKYYPKSWELFEQFSGGYICECVEQNLTKGISQGMYRKDLQPKIIAVLYTTQIRHIGENLSRLAQGIDFVKFYSEFLKYHIHGIASDEGIAYLENINIEK